MEALNINALVGPGSPGESGEEITRRILMEDPIVRVLLVGLAAGQNLPEYTANALLTIYSLEGRVLLYERGERCEMTPGSLVRIAPGQPHRLEAREDSRLLVIIVKPSDASGWAALAPQGRELDLRRTPRERRHSTVFYAFDNLAVGDWFYLVNDHDPMPLHAQMDDRRPGEVSWEYEVRGPHEFRIKVGRLAGSPGDVKPPRTGARNESEQRA